MTIPGASAKGEVDLGAMFEVTSVGMAQAEPTSRRFLRVNAAFCAITGYDEAELLAMTVDQINVPEDRVPDQARFAQLIRGEIREYRVEKRCLRKDGSEIWVQTTANLIRDEQGRPLRTVAVIQDITARRQAEADAAKSRARAVALAEATRAVIEAGPGPDAVLTAVARQAAAQVGDLAVIRLLSADERWLEPVAVDHPEPAVRDAIETALSEERHPADQGATGAALRTGRPQRLTANGIARRQRMDDAALWPSLPEAATGAMLAVPLRAHGRAIGTVSVSRAAPEHAYDEEDERFVQELADRAGLAIERSRLYAAAQQSEERYRDLLTRIDQGFCLIEMLYDEQGRATDYRFLEVNPTFARHTGLEDAVGNTARSLVPGLEDHWIELYARVAETGASTRFEQGSVPMGRWFEVEAVRVGGEGSRKVALLFEDVTERKRFEAALRESEANFRHLANAMPQFVWIAEADGRLSFVNDRWMAFSGLTLAETNDPPRMDTLFHPEDRGRVAAAWQRSLANGAPIEVEARLRDRSGGYRWLLIRGLPVRGDAATDLRWFGTSTDITAAKEAEAHVSAANERFRRAEEAAAALSFDWDLATDHIERSAGLRSVLGYAPEELPPTWEAWSALIHPDDRNATKAEALATFEALTGGAAGYEYRARHRDGTYRWLFERATLVRDAAGKLIRVVGQTVDISARKQAEADREALLDAIAHDLRNPLTTLKLQVQLLERQLERRGLPEPAVLADRLAGFVDLATRMSVLIDELGDQARVTLGQDAALDRQATDLVSLVRHALDDLAPTAGEIELRVRSAAASLIGYWDPVQLRRVVDNLIGNAVKYSPAGGTIEVGIARDDTAAVLTVRDNGIGIPVADLPEVFAFRRRGGNVGEIAGSGVGLAGARQIVARHGGTIAVESREGAGSTFTVRLPLTAPPDGAPS